MSVLGSLTQANPQSYFFALASQGPGAGIQSPASVIPDGTGNTTLALTATGTAGASAISVTGSAGVPGGSGAITVGGFGTVYRAAVLDNSGVFQIGLNSSAPPVIQYDSQVTHQLLLGDKSGVASASVQTNVPFIVRDYTNDPTVANGLGMEVASPTLSTIANTLASGGTLNIGSSLAASSTLVVSDVPSHGAANYIQVKGGVGSVPLFVSGAQGIGGVCYMYPDAVPPTASQLRFGADSSNSDVLQISSSAVTVGTLGIPPVYPCMVARQALPPAPGPTFAYGAGTYTLTMAGLPDGLYLATVYPVAGTAGPTDLNTLGSCFSTNFVVKGGLCVRGGAATNNTGDVVMYPASGLASILFGITLAINYYFAIDFFQLSGAVPGV